VSILGMCRAAAFLQVITSRRGANSTGTYWISGHEFGSDQAEMLPGGGVVRGFDTFKILMIHPVFTVIVKLS